MHTKGDVDCFAVVGERRKSEITLKYEKIHISWRYSATQRMMMEWNMLLIFNGFTTTTLKLYFLAEIFDCRLSLHTISHSSSALEPLMCCCYFFIILFFCWWQREKIKCFSVLYMLENIFMYSGKYKRVRGEKKSLWQFSCFKYKIYCCCLLECWDISWSARQKLFIITEKK